MARESSEAEDELNIGKSVEREGEHYIKTGEFSDVWRGQFKQKGGSVKIIVIKVLRGAPTHNKEVQEQVQQGRFVLSVCRLKL